MKGWHRSSSSSSSNRSGHHSACSLSASPIPVSLIHIETKTVGVVDSTVPPSSHSHLLSFFHCYQNVSFVWDGSMPSFLKKQTHYSLISYATAGGGGTGIVRPHGAGESAGKLLKSLAYLCSPLPPSSSSPSSSSSFLFPLKQEWEAGGRVPAEPRDGGHRWLCWSNDRGTWVLVFAPSFLESFMYWSSFFHRNRFLESTILKIGEDRWMLWLINYTLIFKMVNLRQPYPYNWIIQILRYKTF